MLAAAARPTGDLNEAEECAQDAYTHALTAWPQTGVPDNPGAWLTMVPPGCLIRIVDVRFGWLRS